MARLAKALLSTLPPDFVERWKNLDGDHDPGVLGDGESETVIYACHGDVIATLDPGGCIGKRDPLKASSARFVPVMFRRRCGKSWSLPKIAASSSITASIRGESLARCCHSRLAAAAVRSRNS